MRRQGWGSGWGGGRENFSMPKKHAHYTKNMDVSDRVFRGFTVAFYLLVAVDCFIDTRASPWMQPSDIAVTKLPALFEDGLGWTPPHDVIAASTTAAAWFALIAAVVPCAYFPLMAIHTAAAYTFAYFATAMNHYQHKYLLCILLWIMPFTQHNAVARRLLHVQLGIVYAWTAVTKVADGGLFAGAGILPLLSMTARNHAIVQTVADALGVHGTRIWQAASVGVICVEVVLAVLLVTDRAPLVAILLGVCLHAGIELSGTFRIGFFSFYMLLFFALLIPKVQLRKGGGESN